MKLVKQKRKTDKTELIRVYLSELEQYVMFAYLFCMLGIFPLYYKEKYYQIGDAKFDFFWKASLLFIMVSGFFLIIKMIVQKTAYKKERYEYRKKNANKEQPYVGNALIQFLDELSFLDYAVFIYGICVCISYIFSDYKEYAFKGAYGWNMGFCSQLIFVAIYFFISKKKEYFLRIEDNFCVKLLLGIHIVVSTIVFMLGILHRFDIDPLGMYEGLNLNQKVEFLSTIGQATWFSSYVCTTFAIGLALLYVSKKNLLRIISGIYTIISFGILVTQNSDSAFIAIGGILLLLGIFSLSSKEKWVRFLQIISILWGTFAGMGALQNIFATRAIPLDTLSVFFSTSFVTVVMFVFSSLILMFYQQSKMDTAKLMQITKKIYYGLMVILAIGIMATIIFIYLNTKGYLLRWFGYQSTHHYLLFDYHWGSNRGSTWIITWQAFGQLPFYQKLFGVGPDSLSEYLYSVPQFHDLLRSLWGRMRLTNAHNEYLNSLMCYGIVGIVSWCSVLFGGITYFYKKATDNPMMIGFALCIVGYACHNIFCYQQVCCTPFLFILLGVGESLTKYENFNTIK